MDDLGKGYGVYMVDFDQVVTKLPLYVPINEGIHGVLKEFASSIREGREPATSGQDNLYIVATIISTSKSSHQEKTVYPDDLLTNSFVK